MLKSIDAIIISTRNMDRLIEFYKALGVPLKVGDHGGGLHAETDFGDVHFALQPWESHEVAATNVTFSFNVPDLEEHCKELEARGLTLKMQPTPMPFGGVIAKISDPDGNQVIMNRWQSKEEYARNFPK